MKINYSLSMLEYADRLILLTGANGTKARRAQVEDLNNVDDSESLILAGMGSLLGEGFDSLDLIPCLWLRLFRVKMSWSSMQIV